MRVLLVSSYLVGSHGGASVAASRLFRGLTSRNIDISLLVKEREGDDSTLVCEGPFNTTFAHKLRYRFDTRWAMRYALRQRPKGPWDVGWLPGSVPGKVHQLRPDIVHLHWINEGFMSVEDVGKLNRPLVWTMHDFWAFTGGCHVPHSCEKYHQACGACPLLGSTWDRDISWWSLQRKVRSFSRVPITLIAPSRWMADRARNSTVFHGAPVRVIPNGVDLTLFHPGEKMSLRRKLGLPQDKRLILFGAVCSTSDLNKGSDLLQAAIRYLAQSGWKDRAEIVIFGSSQDDSEVMGLRAHYLGFIRDEHVIATIYAAADVFVIPSRQENLPYTVAEALACGTPCVGFQVGGMADLIDHQQNGYLAVSFGADDLARGIAWVLEDEQRAQQVSANARRKAQQVFSLEVVAKQHVDLYQSLIEEKDT